MHGNKQAYDEAYQRALQGRPSRPFWGILLAPFEDEYTRRSREEGLKDGQAAREIATVGEGLQETA